MPVLVIKSQVSLQHQGRFKCSSIFSVLSPFVPSTEVSIALQVCVCSKVYDGKQWLRYLLYLPLKCKIDLAQ